MVYLPAWKPQKKHLNVGKYTRPMECYGLGNVKIMWLCLQGIFPVSLPENLVTLHPSGMDGIAQMVVSWTWKCGREAQMSYCQKVEQLQPAILETFGVIVAVMRLYRRSGIRKGLIQKETLDCKGLNE